MSTIMLDRDLMLDQSLILYEDLNDVLKALDEFVELHEGALQRYGDRLGGLLRLSKESGMQISRNPSQQVQSKDPGQKRKGSEKEPWTVFKLDNEGNVNIKVANPTVLSPLTAENALLFRTIEALKTKLLNLQTARKTISDLPTLGYRANQRFLVAFVDGLPKQIIPTEQSYSSTNRFQFKEEFTLGLLDESQDLIPV